MIKYLCKFWFFYIRSFLYLFSKVEMLILWCELPHLPLFIWSQEILTNKCYFGVEKTLSFFTILKQQFIFFQSTRIRKIRSTYWEYKEEEKNLYSVQLLPGLCVVSTKIHWCWFRLYQYKFWIWWLTISSIRFLWIITSSKLISIPNKKFLCMI